MLSHGDATMAAVRGSGPGSADGRVRAAGRASVRFLAACVLVPAQAIGMLFLALWLLIRHPLVTRRLRRRYRVLAGRLGIDRGVVISFEVTGGAMVTPALVVVSLWPGAPDEVVDALVEGVRAGGYEL